MKSYVIGSNDAGQRLDKFVGKICPSLPKNLLYKYIRIKRIKVNRKRTEISYILNEDDLLELYINDEFFVGDKWDDAFLSSDGEIDVVYEDENIIVINKPAGLVTHGAEENLVDKVKKYCYNKGEFDYENEVAFAPALCNRIDRNTSGLVIAAKTAAALRAVNEKIRLGEINKYYYCLAVGSPNPPLDKLSAYLIKNEKENKVEIFDEEKEGAKQILTEYKTVEDYGECSVLEIKLLTGRPHQIRAHLAHIGYPIAGDTKYGNPSFNKKLNLFHQALCAYKLEFDFKDDDGPIGYLKGKEIALPKEKCSIFKIYK